MLVQRKHEQQKYVDFTFIYSTFTFSQYLTYIQQIPV